MIVAILTLLSFVIQALLSSEELANVPFLVLGNKIDLGTAPSEEDLRYQLGLYETYGKDVSVFISFFSMILNDYNTPLFALSS